MIHDFSDKSKKIEMTIIVKVSAIFAFSLILLGSYPTLIQPAAAAKFILRVEEQVYTPGESLVIYGAGEANDVILVRIFGASGRAISIGNVVTDSSGFFRETIWRWDDPSADIPFGTYTIEAISSLVSKDTRRAEVVFTAATAPDNEVRIPITHTLAVKLNSPDQVSINEPFRVFIQVTFDGALLAANGTEITDLLGTSHIHSGDQYIPLTNLTRLHEGLFYADVTIREEGPYIIHSAAFYRGLLAHDSKVITATSSSISTIQESVRELDARLDSTNRELAGLQQGIQDTKGALNQTQATITSSVNAATDTINSQISDVQQASGQINSLILPVLALISVIIALQISLFARIRASFR